MLTQNWNKIFGVNEDGDVYINASTSSGDNGLQGQKKELNDLMRSCTTDSNELRIILSS